MTETQKKNYEAWRKIRNDWGDINPVTKIVPNKKKNERIKHKKKMYDEQKEEIND